MQFIIKWVFYFYKGLIFIYIFDMKIFKKKKKFQFFGYGCINGLNERNLLGLGQLINGFKLMGVEVQQFIFEGLWN